jgi:hypothetical protein
VTFKTNIEEMAISAAKRFDHAEITAAHILYALKKSLDDEISFVGFEAIEKLMNNIASAHTNQISISAEAQEILNKIA